MKSIALVAMVFSSGMALAPEEDFEGSAMWWTRPEEETGAGELPPSGLVDDDLIWNSGTETDEPGPQQDEVLSWGAVDLAATDVAETPVDTNPLAGVADVPFDGLELTRLERGVLAHLSGHAASRDLLVTCNAHLAQRGLHVSAAGQPEERQLLDWHMANLEFANSERLDSLSLRHWDQDDPNELPGAHTFVPGGNARWVRALARDLVIYYDSPVRAVHYGARGVEVHTPRHTFRADAAVVTVPLGCLKAGDVEFRPALTPRKLGAVARINFGTLNKVVLLFPHAFWGRELDMFGRATPSPDHRGDSFLFYSSDVLSGGAVLVALVAGASIGPPKGRWPHLHGALADHQEGAQGSKYQALPDVAWYPSTPALFSRLKSPLQIPFPQAPPQPSTRR